MRAGGVKSSWEENNPAERRPFDLISFSQSQGGLALHIMEIILIGLLLPTYLSCEENSNGEGEGEWCGVKCLNIHYGARPGSEQARLAANTHNPPAHSRQVSRSDK